MYKEVVVVGAGGFGREALDVLEAMNIQELDSKLKVLGVIDDNPSSSSLSRLADRGYMHLGSLQEWLGCKREALYVVAIGAPEIRRRICSTLESAGHEPLSAIHPSAVIGSRVRLGRGAVICAGVKISTNVAIGDYVHINPGVIIGHDAALENFSSINPGAIISGEVRIRESCLIGAGAVVLQGLTVGTGSTVGAGGVVTRDVEADKVVKGVPAR